LVDIKRGEIYLARFDPAFGSEMGKTRPCLIIQNDVGNTYSPNTIVLAITSKITENLPTCVFVPKNISSLEKDSSILCSHIYTFSIKNRLIKKLGAIEDKQTLLKIEEALKISLDLE